MLTCFWHGVGHKVNVSSGAVEIPVTEILGMRIKHEWGEQTSSSRWTKIIIKLLHRYHN